MALPQSYFPDAIDAHLPAVYHLAFRMTLDRAQAAEAAYETFLRAWYGKRDIAPETLGSWLLKIASHVVEARLPGAPEVSFDLLDETLRSEATRTGEVRSLSNPEREYLLWELKQGCMTSVVNCISPGERVAFVLGAILGKTDEEAAVILGIKASAYKVRLSRARKKISDYLQPRCEHVDPRNPCHCPSRIGVALQRGFIAPPAQPVVQLRAFERADRGRDPAEIYRTLPAPEVDPEDHPEPRPRAHRRGPRAPLPQGRRGAGRPPPGGAGRARPGADRGHPGQGPRRAARRARGAAAHGRGARQGAGPAAGA